MKNWKRERKEKNRGRREGKQKKTTKRNREKGGVE